MRFLPEPVMPSNHGFSLVETFIGLALVALLLGFAVPAWKTQIIAKEVETASGHLFRDLQLARVEAIRRGVPVVLCPSEDGASCLWGGEWHKGWIGFEDPDRNQRREPAEAILVIGSSTAPITIRWRSPNWLRFMPQGEAWPNGHFRVCDKTRSLTYSVIVYRTGRARLGNKSPSGASILC
jgi:type IV fimbrial biogenesis protein FimT